MSIVQIAPEQKPNHVFYRDVLNILRQAEIPFLISGGFALQQFTGILREVRDLDIFVLEKHIHAALEALAHSGSGPTTLMNQVLKVTRRDPVGDLSVILKTT